MSNQRDEQRQTSVTKGATNRKGEEEREEDYATMQFQGLAQFFADAESALR